MGTFGAVANSTGNRVLRWVCVAVAALVPISRMYIGVHTPADVLVGGGMALVLVFAMKPVIYGKDGKYILPMLLCGVLTALAYIAYVEFFPFPADTDPANLASAVKNGYTLLGALLGMLVVHYVDETKLHFPVKAVWWAQILKVAIGLALALAVKEGLKGPLDALFSGHYLGRGVRYFLLVIVAGIVWPLSFPWFSRLGKKQ